MPQNEISDVLKLLKAGCSSVATTCPCAGQFRTTMLGKAERAGQPPTWFTPPHLLEHEAQPIFDSLHRSDLFRRIQPIELARKAARLLAEINALHAGHQLHFDVVSRERMVQASIEANRGNFGMMIRLFEEIIDAGRVQPLRRAIIFLTRASFNWNDTCIATTVAGENYSGRLVGRDGESFMMRSDDNRILIGRGAILVARYEPASTFRFVPSACRARSQSTR